MNILAVSNYKYNNPFRVNNSQTGVSMPKFGLIMSKPLSKDTVSFGNKMLQSRKLGLNYESSIKAHNIAVDMQAEIERFIKGLFSEYMPENNKKPLIAYVAGRAKEPGSIQEKSAVLESNGIPASSIADVLRNMTDLNGTKAVMVDGSRVSTHRVLSILLKRIQSGFVYLEEVEVKRPSAAKNLKGKDKYKYDYEEPSKLAQFVSDAEESMGTKVNFPEAAYTKANYPAIHMLLRLPGQKRAFEFQITGYNVAVFKDLDDILFKILNNKNVDPEYKPIVDILQTILLTKEENGILKYAKIQDRLEKLKFSTKEIQTLLNRVAMDEALTNSSDSPEYTSKVKSLIKTKDMSKKDLAILLEHAEYAITYANKEALKLLKQKAEKQEKFATYRAQAFLYQREKKVSSFGSDAPEYFLPLSVDLPPEFDLNHLYKIYLACKEKIKKRDKKA